MSPRSLYRVNRPIVYAERTRLYDSPEISFRAEHLSGSIAESEHQAISILGQQPS